MTKLFVTAFLSLMFISQAFASTGTGLKPVFDDLNYALKVEWDQQDEVFLEKQKELFFSRLSALESQGVSLNEMANFAVSTIKDKQSADEASSVFSLLLTHQIDHEEANERLFDIVDSSYSKGASWSGRTAVFIIVPAILVAAVVLVATCSAKKTKGDRKTGGLCGTTDHL